MAKVRIGFSTHFEIENELAGIGTDNPTNTKQVLGNIRSSDAKAIGVSTFTTFDGFTDTKLSLQGSAGAKQGTTSGEIIIEGEITVSSGTTFTSGPENLTVTDSFTLPGINDDKPSVGTTRFNDNLGALEFYTGVEWRAVNSYVDMGNRGRGCFAGGRDSGSSNQADIGFIEIATKGDAINFGDLATARMWPGGCGSAIRGIFGSGSPSTNIDYITIASGGNGTTFGTCSQSGGAGACSSSTRALFAGGYSGGANTIEFIEIQTLGNASSFGSSTLTTNSRGGCSNGTRGVFGGGEVPSPQTGYNVIDYITIQTTGNATDFGDLIIGRRQTPAGLAGA